MSQNAPAMVALRSLMRAIAARASATSRFRLLSASALARPTNFRESRRAFPIGRRYRGAWDVARELSGGFIHVDERIHPRG
jgi:hypothetical protein